MKKVILDTNIWRYLSDRDELFQLMKITADHELKIVMPPSIPLEILRMRDSALRDKLLALVCHKSWHKLMPEAYMQSMELLNAIKEFHPEWLYEKPNKAEYESLRGDWIRKKTGFWDFIKLNPGQYKSIGNEEESAVLEGARAEIKKHRTSMLNQNLTFDNCKLDDIKGKIANSNFEPRDYWRIENEFFSWEQLFILSSNTYQEWLCPFVNRKRITRSAWREFWYDKIEAKSVSRWWITWAFQLLVYTRSISPGSPCDIQLSNHLYDADYFFSSDKIFIEITTKCRRFSPKPMAQGFRTSVENVLSEISNYLANTNSITQSEKFTAPR